MSDPILSLSEKKRLEQDEKTVMAMAAVEPATPALPNAIDLPCGKESRKSWPIVDRG